MATPAQDQQGEFEKTALAYFNALYNVALRLTRNPSDAQDLVQETLLKAYRFFDRFEPGTNIKAWLFTILRNAYINTYRKNKKGAAWGQVDVDKVVPYLQNPLHLSVKIEWTSRENMRRYGMHDETMHALDNLPEKYRELIFMVDLHDFSYMDAAFIAGCPVGTVMSRLHRGRKILYEKLEVFARKSGYVRN